MTQPTLRRSDPMKMRIDLSEDGENLHPLAYYACHAFMFFPNCAASRDQAIGIADSEVTRREEDPSSQLSDIAHTSTMAVKKQAGKRETVGWVAMAMALAQRYGVSRALEVCSSVVSERVLSSKQAGTFDFWFHSKHGLQSGSQNLISGATNIQNAFREYRSVAHLCAANLWAGRHAEEGDFFIRRPDYEAQFLATAAAFQRELSGLYRERRWPMLDINGALPPAVRDIEHFHIFSCDAEALFASYLSKE